MNNGAYAAHVFGIQSGQPTQLVENNIGNGAVKAGVERNFGSADMSWLAFYTILCYAGSALVAVLTLSSWWYFSKKRSNGTATVRVTAVNIVVK